MFGILRCLLRNLWRNNDGNIGNEANNAPDAQTAAEADSEAGEVIVEAAVPLAAAPEEIADTDVPLAAPVAWSLVNLILTILTSLGSVLLLLGYLGKKSNKGIRRLFSLLPAIAAVAAFILTEDMRLPMTMVDRWTVLMLVIALAQVGVALICKKVKEVAAEAAQPVNA